jgi:Cu-Zn family superoxide dismutase
MTRTERSWRGGALASSALGALLVVLAGCGSSSSERRQDEPATAADRYETERSGDDGAGRPGEGAREPEDWGQRSGSAEGDDGARGDAGRAAAGAEWAAGETSPLAERYPSATARLMGARGHERIGGTAAFVQTPAGLRVSIQVTDAPPGWHGVHVHENGSCDLPDFQSAGEHYNPQGHPHGLPTEAADRHIGDLGNMLVAPDGKGHISMILVEPNVKAEDELSFVGRAIVVHAEEDTGQGDSGESGARIACGVIGQGEGSGAADSTGDRPGSRSPKRSGEDAEPLDD